MTNRALPHIRFDRAHFLLGIVMIPLVATCGMAYARAAVPPSANTDQRIVLVERERRDISADMLADSDGQQEAVRRQTHFLPAYTAHAARPATVNLVTGRRLDFPLCDQKPLFSRATVRAIDDRGPPHAG